MRTWIGTFAALCVVALAPLAAGAANFQKNFGTASGDATIQGTAVDTSGNVYVVGNFTAASLAIGGVTLTSRSGGVASRADLFVAKLDASGNTLWAFNFGDTRGVAYGSAVSTDASGNVYVAGEFFNNTDYLAGKVLAIDPRAPGITATTKGFQDVLVLSFDSAGNLRWAKDFGGTGARPEPKRIVSDGSHSLYVVGAFFGSGTGPRFEDRMLIGTMDGFILRVADADGSLQWIQTFGGASAVAYAYGIAANADHIYVGGYFYGADLTTPTLARRTTSGTTGLVARLDPIFGDFVWQKAIGSDAAGSLIYDLAIDSGNNVYAAGGVPTLGNLDPPMNVVGTMGTATARNAVAIKMNDAGTVLWTRNFGGPTSVVDATGIALDADGSVYLGGYFRKANLQIPNADMTVPAVPFAGIQKGFALKFRPTDPDFTTTWEIGFGGSNTGVGYDPVTPVRIATDNVRNIAVTGDFKCSGPDPCYGGNILSEFTLVRNGTRDGLVFMRDTRRPVVTTGAASAVTLASATLAGTVDPNTVTVSAIGFQIGTTTSYGATAAATPGSLAASDPLTSVSADLTSLACNTVYHYRAYATHPGRTEYGADATFTTPPCTTGPVVSTSAPSPLLQTSATLRGSVQDVGRDVSGVVFEFGETTAYGTTLPGSVTTITATPGSPQTILPTASVSNLWCGRTYHFRVGATDPNATNYSPDRAFQAASCTAQTISFATIPAKTFNDPPFDVNPVASSNLPVTLVSTTTDVCTVAPAAVGYTVTIVAVGTGTCTLEATQGGNASYAAAPLVTRSFTVNKSVQATFSASATPSSIGYGESSTLGTTGGSGGGSVSYAVTGGITFCSVTGATLFGSGVGTCTVTATRAGDANYLPATATVDVTVSRATQVITLGAAPPVVVGGTGTVVATGGASGNPIVFTSATPSTCSVFANVVTGVTAGSCTILADQAGNAFFQAASQVSQTITVGKGSQAALTVSASPASIAFGGTAVVGASGGSGTGSGLSFAVAAGPCTVSGTTLTGVGIGSCSVTATKDGDGNYNPVTGSTTVVVNKATQTITFGPAPTVVVGGTGVVAATGGGSGNPVVFSSLTPVTCAVVGTVVTGLANGTCTVAANQAGGANHLAADQATLPVGIGRATQSIVFGAAPSLVVGGTGTVTATGGGSGNPVLFSSLTPATCSVSGSTVSAAAAGTCTIAANQAGAGDFDPAPQATQSVVVAKAAQSIAFGVAPSVVVGGTGSVSATGGNSGNPIVFSAATPTICTVAGSTVAGVSAGTCVVAANQAGNANYHPAPQVLQSFTVVASTGALTLSTDTIAFGGQSMYTTSLVRRLTVSNLSTATVVVNGAATSTFFAAANHCGTLTSGASCTFDVTFTPETEGLVTGFLAIYASPGTLLVGLSGNGERSLSTHYFQSILRRPPDPAGQAFWEAEAARAETLGLGANEVWRSMAVSFFNSPEYRALGLDDEGYVRDLYATFFNRAPDPAGLTYWLGLLQSGMTRESVLSSFLFSGELDRFAEELFGDTSQRAEVGLLGDLYRGLLSRLPDTDGFNYWIRMLRTAQCTGREAVRAVADEVSGLFVGSGEYAARGRSDLQYVGDLYDALMRRGSDLAGLQYWAGQLALGATTRDGLRRMFLATPEFTARVDAIVAQGCLAQR